MSDSPAPPETVSAGETKASGTPTVASGAAVPAPPTAAARPPSQTSPPAPTRAASPPVAQAPTRAASPPVAQPAPPKPAALDLSSLEQRLRETKAIGAFTKIALKNQVDDLLAEFRTYYQGKRDTDLARLRRSYDLLVMKFLSLLQDDDKPLANAIVASREEIWGILSDRTKFATL